MGGEPSKGEGFRVWETFQNPTTIRQSGIGVPSYKLAISSQQSAISQTVGVVRRKPLYRWFPIANIIGNGSSFLQETMVNYRIPYTLKMGEDTILASGGGGGVP